MLSLSKEILVYGDAIFLRTRSKTCLIASVTQAVKRNTDSLQPA